MRLPRTPRPAMGTDRGPRELTFAQEAWMDVPEDRYREIEEAIASEESPVGIDAKRTHIMILYMLEELHERVARLEEQLGTSPSSVD